MYVEYSMYIPRLIYKSTEYFFFYNQRLYHHIIITIFTTISKTLCSRRPTLFDDDVIKAWSSVDDEHCINAFYNSLSLVHVIKIKKTTG